MIDCAALYYVVGCVTLMFVVWVLTYGYLVWGLTGCLTSCWSVNSVVYCYSLWVSLVAILFRLMLCW